MSAISVAVPVVAVTAGAIATGAVAVGSAVVVTKKAIKEGVIPASPSMAVTGAVAYGVKKAVDFVGDTYDDVVDYFSNSDDSPLVSSAVENDNFPSSVTKNNSASSSGAVSDNIIRDGVSALSNQSASVIASVPDTAPNIKQPVASGDTLTKVLANNGVGNIEAVNNNTVVLNDIAIALKQMLAVNSTLFPSLIASVSAIPKVIENSKTESSIATGENVKIENNVNVDTESIVNSLTALKEGIATKERNDYFVSANEVNNYRTKERTISDAFGNDVRTISPIALEHEKYLGDSIATALENSTTAEEAGIEDIEKDFENIFESEMLKLFKFNGIEDNLSAIASSVIAGTASYSPDVTLKD